MYSRGSKKSLKYLLLTYGNTDVAQKRLKTHNIVGIIDYVEEITDYIVPDSVKSIAGMVTLWESEARYGAGNISNVKMLLQAIGGYEQLGKEIVMYEKRKKRMIEKR